MKLFKNPIFAVFICLLLIVSATCVSSVGKLNREYRKVNVGVCDAIIDYAAKERLNDLELRARNMRADASADKGDFDSLIAEYNSAAAEHGNNGKSAKAVEKAIDSYRAYYEKLQTFPAKLFAPLLNR